MLGRAAARLAAYQDLIRSAYRRWTIAPDAKLPGRTLDLEIKTVRDVTGLCTVLCAYRLDPCREQSQRGPRPMEKSPDHARAPALGSY
jgi:hypothetical protein